MFDADGDGIEEIVYYNGWKGGEHIKGPSDIASSKQNGSVKAERLGIENMAATCVQGRGVLIDLHKHFGDERVFVSFDDLVGVMKQDGVVVGRVICWFCIQAGRYAYGMKLNPNAEKLHSSCAVLNGMIQIS